MKVPSLLLILPVSCLLAIDAGRPAKIEPAEAVPVQKEEEKKKIVTEKTSEEMEAALKKIRADYKEPSDKELREKLTAMQYKVTKHEGTEPARDNKYWDNKKEGLYVDLISGTPLFTSSAKYKSGTGWPSFFQPIHADEIVLVEDRKFFMVRVEVRSKTSDSHLGHVFEDGPEPTGKRYCMNSAAMRFIPKEELKEAGLEAYLELFEEKK